MKLYTSYWAQVRNFPPNLIGLNTTRFPPKWRPMGKDKRGVICVDCPPFKPGRQCTGLCDGSCNPKHPEDCGFIKEYKKQIYAMDIEVIKASLKRLENLIYENEELDDINFAFLVFETPTNTCSERNVIQQWFRDNGVEITEWYPSDEHPASAR